MNGTKPVVAALVCTCVLALPASSQETFPDQRGSLRRQLAESRELLAQLAKQIDILEKQLARSEPDVHFPTPPWSQDDRGEAKSPPRIPSRGSQPVVLEKYAPDSRKDSKERISNRVEEGMQLDAIERRMRGCRRR